MLFSGIVQVFFSRLIFCLDNLFSSAGFFYPSTLISKSLSRDGCFIDSLPQDLHSSYLDAIENAKHQVFSAESNIEKSSFNLPVESARLQYFCRDILSYITPSVKSYLGVSSKLDSAYLACVKCSDFNYYTSGVLHHDSVGRRLKIYVPMFLSDLSSLSAPLLEYLLGSQLLSHSHLSNPAAEDGFRNNETLIRKLYPSSLLRSDSKSFMAFDTNGYHRGCYESGSGLRCDLVLEFSTIKSLFIRGYIGYSAKASLPDRFIPRSLCVSSLRKYLTSLFNPHVNSSYD